MSEIENIEGDDEAQDAPDAPAEPDAPLTHEEEEELIAAEMGDDGVDLPEPEEAPEPDAPQGISEKELEAGRKKLEAEGTRHRNRVSDIMGEEANFLEPCPLCSGFIDGLIFPQTPPPDVVEKVRVAIGMPDLSNYQQAKHARMCDDCAGLGVVLSGSLVAENAAINCVACNGSGYTVIARETGELVPPTPANGVTVQALPEGVNPEDPAVKELRARGFYVAPLMQVGNPA